MKKLKFLSVAFLAMGLCLNFTACSDDDDDSVTIYDDEDLNEEEEEVYEPVIVEINVEKAGTLESLVEGANFSYPDILKILGNLNGDDIVFIRDGSYNLSGVLDLSEAQIVEGGIAYYTDSNNKKYYTEAGKIGDYMFEAFEKSLEEMILPNSITEIGWRSFRVKNSSNNYKYFKVKKITLPEGLLKIKDEAFSGQGFVGGSCCSYLREINIPNSVTTIGISVFQCCGQLESITIPESITEIPYNMFYNCKSMTNVNLHDGITEIGGCAFSGCESFTDITLPNNLITIGYEAFYNCSNLYTLTIGSGVESIGDYAFEGCDRLEYIYCYATTPPTLGSSVFSKTNTFVYVPQGTLHDYVTNNRWSVFSYIWEME